MEMRCRTCGSALRGLEVLGAGGGGVYFKPSPEFSEESKIPVSSEEYDEILMCAYLDGYPCRRCGTADLAVADVRRLLEYEEHRLPHSSHPCPACDRNCLGPRPLECAASSGRLLAFIEPKYGAPLDGHLCPSCGRVWLRLHPDDSRARSELAGRFPDHGPCPSCGQGRLRVTELDAPHSGIVYLHDFGSDASPDVSDDAKPNPESGDLSVDLKLTLCDSCGAGSVRCK